MHPDLELGMSYAWAAHRSNVGSTFQIHQDRHTIEFDRYHPQTGEFMVAADYSIRSGECVALMHAGDLEELLGDGRG